VPFRRWPSSAHANGFNVKDVEKGAECPLFPWTPGRGTTVGHRTGPQCPVGQGIEIRRERRARPCRNSSWPSRGEESRAGEKSTVWPRPRRALAPLLHCWALNLGKVIRCLQITVTVGTTIAGRPPGRRRQSPTSGSHRTQSADFPHWARRTLIHSMAIACNFG
jgi:hypothetical protein